MKNRNKIQITLGLVLALLTCFVAKAQVVGTPYIASVVSSGPVTPTAPTNATGTGTFTGRTCFDIVESNDNINECAPLSSRMSQKADFSLTAINTQSYTFTPSGTVSNVRFVFVNTNGTPIIAISGDNTGNSISTPVVATVNYGTNLNTTALGTTRSTAFTADIYVVYNDGATNNGTDKQLKLTAAVKDCSCCGAFVAAGVWKAFMCHNLGADESLDPNVPVQGIHGNYYQWGRSTMVANASTPATAISSWNTTSAPSGSWLDASKTANDPCPSGYRVPTIAQWTGVVNTSLNTQSRTGTWGANSATNFGSAIHFGPNASTKSLTLPAAGYRLSSGGTLSSRGYFGSYWSSTGNGTYATSLYFTSSPASTTTSYLTSGLSVRCVSE